MPGIHPATTSDGFGPSAGPALWLALVLCLLCVSPALAQGDGGLGSEETIILTENQRSRIPLLLEEFVRGPGASRDDAAAVQAVVEQDLKFSGVFRILTIPTIANPEDLVSQKEEALVRGEVSVSDGELTLRGTLEALPARSLIFVREYRTTPDNYREVAHRFADDIVLYLTGEAGIARTRICFVLNNGRDKEIYVVDYDGHGLTQLTQGGGINLSPDWRPDGSEIAYVSYGNGDPDIFSLALGTGEIRPVVTGPGVQSAPAWSPVGEQLAFSNTVNGKSSIRMCDARGEGVRGITSGKGIDTSPCWSPDGRRLAFTSDRSGNPQIYLMNSEGGDVRRLTFGGKWNDLAAWNPGGDRIMFASREQSRFHLFEVDPAGLRSYKKHTYGDGSNETPSWAPDGRHLVFSSSRGGAKGLYILNTDDGVIRPLLVGRGECSAPDWSTVPPR